MTSTHIDGGATPTSSPHPVDTQTDSFRDESKHPGSPPSPCSDTAAIYDLLLDLQNRLGEHAAHLLAARHSLDDASASLVILRDHVVDHTPLKPEL